MTQRGPVPAKGHMPFPGHRTLKQVREDETRHAQLPWCPIEYRENYLHLRRKGWSAAEARPLIEQLIKADKRRQPTETRSGRG